MEGDWRDAIGREISPPNSVQSVLKFVYAKRDGSGSKEGGPCASK
jgi:hypothetical protein